MTNEKINSLIAIEKKIIEVNPRKTERKREEGDFFRIENRCRRSDMKIEGFDVGKKLLFSAFIRINADFPDDYSIGLVFQDDEGKETTLIRCNGNHGFHKNKVINNNFFDNVHIHKATQEAIEANLKAENFAEPTDKYASWQEALQHFFHLVRINNGNEFYPIDSQLELFE